MPPALHRVMAEVVAMLREQIVHVVERQWKPDVKCHDIADDLGCQMEDRSRLTCAARDLRGLTVCDQPASRANTSFG